MNKDVYGRPLLSEREVCEFLYQNPTADLTHLELADPSMHNNACKVTYSDIPLIKAMPELVEDPAIWHHNNQKNYKMPEEYEHMDIAQYLLDQCDDDEELERCGMELMEFAKRDLMLLLCYLKYLVDTMRSHGVVWGVGRGSSVASFVLYKLGVHRINPLHYELDFSEFMRD